jgi:hypothetical protein
MTDRLLDYKGNNLYDASCIAYNANEDWQRVNWDE